MQSTIKENVKVTVMAENSGIEWTDHTFNPWMGCTKVSPACKNCYAERDFDHRYKKVNWGPNGDRRKTTDANWKKPLKWNREAEESGNRLRVFCASLADVFEDWGGAILDHRGNRVSIRIETLDVWRFASMSDLRKLLFDLIDSTPNLDWLLLTKRPENFESMWDMKSRPNVWLGTSIENQKYTDSRLPFIQKAKRLGYVGKTFVSAEPLVSPIDLSNHLAFGLDWVITGGESGPGARACKPEWFRSLRDQCKKANIPFHFKQWGEFDENMERIGKKKSGRSLDGKTYNELPVIQ